MKKFFAFHFLWCLICLLSINVFAQNQNNPTLLGKITIDENGKVTYQAMNDQPLTRSATAVQRQPFLLNEAKSSYSGPDNSSLDIKRSDTVLPFLIDETGLNGNGQPIKSSILQGEEVSSVPSIPNPLKSADSEASITLAAPNLTLKTGSSSITVDGTNITVNVTVTNNGTASAAASEIGYYLSPDISITTTPNYLIGTDAVPTLAIGATSAETITVNVAAMSIPCATYYVFFDFDHLKQVAESNENDNAWYFTSPTVIIPCVPNLDLVSGSASCSVNGTDVTVNLTVVNNGSTLAAASQIGYYLSPDVSITTTPNYLFGTDAVSTLAVGATSAETITVNVAAMSIPCGTYYVFFEFDYLKQVTESNENDNAWYFTNPTVIIPCVPNLDLVTGTGSCTVNGNSVTVSLTVTNNGSSTAGTSEVGYYLSPDASMTTTPNYLIGTDPVSSLAVGGTSAESISVDLSASPVPVGTYYVFFVLDHLLQVTESNENDNTWYFSNPQFTRQACTAAVTPADRAVTSAAGTTSFALTTNCSWTATSNQAWCTLSPATGSGNTTITATYAANTTCAGRTATITITVAGLAPIRVTVTQAPCSISVTPSDQLVLSSEGSTNFTITTNCVWTATSNKSWCTLTPASGNGSGILKASFAPNFTDQDRVASITVTSAGCSSSIVTVTQKAGCFLTAAPDIRNVTSAAGTTTFALSAPTPWSVTSDQGWCTVSPSSGTGSTTVTVTFSSNSTGNSRTASIVFSSATCYWFTAKVIQEGCILSVSPSNQPVTFQEGTTTFALTTTCEWSVACDKAWCTISPASGTGNATLTAQYQANQGDMRTATITVTSAGTPPSSKQVTLTQSEGCCLPSEHFVPAWVVSAPDYMNLNVSKATLDGVNLEPGDEIAAYDGTICVGASKVKYTIDNTHILYIKASKNTVPGNGYIPGHPITYKFWDFSRTREFSGITATYSSGNPSWSTTGLYANGATSYAELNGITTGLTETYLPGNLPVVFPNPTGGQLYVRSGSVSLVGSRVTVINETGILLINKIAVSDLEMLDLSNFTKGLYLLRITGPVSMTEKIVVK